ncbi:polysaccharide biosynthesis PFTS motif protein [Leptospira noguchii]|uniref:polysaccharide biosynthesis PFTS motif protein n=1 Tax=Leptospira noguchii TaxID=28182 RepID=UPI0002BD356A|nr:hypothetical protein LEP1GSC072_2855 [Leptospira noguchii str. Bonito]
MMYIPFVSRFFVSKFLKRNRALLKGYHFLKENNQLDTIPKINRELTNKKLQMTISQESDLIFGSGRLVAELITRQYILLRFAGINLNNALLEVFGKYRSKLVYPLPAEWINMVESNGIPVSKFMSHFLWYVKILIYWCYGSLNIAYTFVFSIRNLLRNQKLNTGDYVYFDSLGKGNLPQSHLNANSDDIITWYSRWPDRNQNIDRILHNVQTSKNQILNGIRIESSSSYLPPLISIANILSYLFWGIKASLNSIFSIFVGRWWNALLLHESSKRMLVRCSESKYLAREYLFHNSNWIYRPLWTYEAEEKGSKISFYFYSTNSQDFKRPTGYPPLMYGWEAMNWPIYLVWDSYQKDFVKRCVNQPVEIKIVGSIRFQGSSVEYTINDPSCITVFDVQPCRDTFYVSLGLSLEYYRPKIANQFLFEIYNVSRDLNLKIILKRKRIVGKLAHPKYRNFISQLEREQHFISIDPNVSAYQLIQKSKIVISMPFTSTALIARELGKVSIYYDPTGLIQKDDRAAHGIPIISGKKELTNWLETTVSDQKKQDNQ